MRQRPRTKKPASAHRRRWRPARRRLFADALRDLVRDYATEHLADENAVLVIDETGFLKQGKASCEVARQYTGSAGKITNCQIGVFAAYVSRHGHAFIDRALYLPKGWTDNPARLKATYVPGDTGFSTKPQLAAEMIERALAAGVPFRWVAADSVYGVGDIERDLRQAGKGYVLGVNSNHWFASWGKPQRVVGTAEEIAKTQRRSDWRRLSAGAGTKGPRLHDWCYLELADLEGEESNHHSQVLWTRGLLIRRNIANGNSPTSPPGVRQGPRRTACVSAVLDSRSTRQPRLRAGRDEKMLSAEPKDRPKEEDRMPSN